jgi:hypothetical protein
MGANPAPLVKLYEEFAKHEPQAVFGGIYANKSGYHNTRANHLKSRPNDYSIQAALDKQGPADKAAALDITFKDAQKSDFKTIRVYTKRLIDAMKKKDSRLYYKGEAVVRECFGNADNDREVEGWSLYRGYAVSSDSSHLWHLHISFHRKFVNNWDAVKGVLDVLLARNANAGGGAPSGSGKEDDEVKAEDIKKIAETTVNKLLAQQIEFTEGEQKRYGPSGYPKSLSVRSLLVHGGGEPRELARMEGLRYDALLYNVQQNDAYIRNVSKQVQSVAEQVSQLAQAVEALSKKLGG